MGYVRLHNQPAGPYSHAKTIRTVLYALPQGKSVSVIASTSAILLDGVYIRHDLATRLREVHCSHTQIGKGKFID